MYRIVQYGARAGRLAGARATRRRGSPVGDPRACSSSRRAAGPAAEAVVSAVVRAKRPHRSCWCSDHRSERPRSMCHCCTHPFARSMANFSSLDATELLAGGRQKSAHTEPNILQSASTGVSRISLAFCTAHHVCLFVESTGEMTSPKASCRRCTAREECNLSLDSVTR